MKREEIVVEYDFRSPVFGLQSAGLNLFRALDFKDSFRFSYVFGIALWPDFTGMNTDFLSDQLLHFGRDRS